MKYLVLGIVLMAIAEAKYYPNALFAKVNGVASSDTLSVRVRPHWHSKKITELPPNAYVGVDECVKIGRSAWCKVDAVNRNLGQYQAYNDKLPGWVNARYLKFSSRGYVAINGKKRCNYAINCSSGKCRVVIDETLKNGKVTAVKIKSYLRSRLKGIGELDIPSGAEGYACGRVGLKIDNYLSKHSNYRANAKSAAKSFLRALESQNLSQIKRYIHPVYGIKITNRLSFREPGAKHFSKKSFVKLYKNGANLNWGRSYGKGEYIRKNLKDFLSQFTPPFSQIHRVKQYTKLQGFSSLTPVKGYEFFWQGKGEDAHYNWQGAVMILAKADGKWYVVGLLRERWVI